MSRFRVVVTDQVFPDVAIERELLAEIDADLVVASGDREAVRKAAEDADGLLNTYMALDAELLRQLPRCRVIARYGIGVDNVDLDAARAAGIVVTNVPDYSVEEVAAHALALLLSLLRRLPQGDAAVRGGGWGVDTVRPIERLSELTVGLVGYGRIARRLAANLRPLGVSLLVHDPYAEVSDEGVRAVGLEELLAQSDAVSLHAPLTPETRGMIGSEQLERMRPHAVLVNTSRGPLVRLADLFEALRSGEIRAAGLDVFESEPPDAAQFEGVPGLLLSPHTAFYSEASLRESQRKAATQVRKVLTGQAPDYQVNA
jgi:D-3-phosphoglycerate dehydrogenase / 2-oxoglutarate reductase